MKVLGVSDLPPDDLRFSVRLKDERISLTPSIAELSKNANAIPTRANNIINYTNYSVYYSDNQPGTNDFNEVYEPLSGSYIYKFSYASDNNYLCSSKVTFDNTQLKCGTQNNNMYTYVAAKSNSQTLDFGLMANPSASNRNQGMYAFYKYDPNFWDVEAHPKVGVTNPPSNNAMTLQDKTVDIRLSIGTGTTNNVEMYMESNGSAIYYKVITVAGLRSLSSNPLTFVQAMSCVQEDNNNTSLTSGSYFKNVTFISTLYSSTKGTRPFPTFGPATYYLFACKPSKLNFSYGSNSETISINYN